MTNISRAIFAVIATCVCVAVHNSPFDSNASFMAVEAANMPHMMSPVHGNMGFHSMSEPAAPQFESAIRLVATEKNSAHAGQAIRSDELKQLRHSSPDSQLKELIPSMILFGSLLIGAFMLGRRSAAPAAAAPAPIVLTKAEMEKFTQYLAQSQSQLSQAQAQAQARLQQSQAQKQ